MGCTCTPSAIVRLALTFGCSCAALMCRWIALAIRSRPSLGLSAWLYRSVCMRTRKSAQLLAVSGRGELQVSVGAHAWQVHAMCKDMMESQSS